MNASRRFASSGSVTISWPSIRTAPVVGRRMPAIDRSVVVLPAPFGPQRPTISPAATSNDRSSTAVKLPYVRPKCSTAIGMAVLDLVVSEVGNYVATHASALKAHRQSLKNRERNRQYRSRLRAALKAVRTALDGKDIAAAKTALKETVSLVDKMASKGIIHRNAAGRYKSRLHTRLAKRA